MGGDTSSLSPTAAASVEKAALGAVSESEFVVNHPESAPVAEVAQPDGNDGVVTESKFCDATVTVAPSVIAAVAAPRFIPPSRSRKVRLMLPPHWPVAVKAKVWVVVPPPARTMP